jgi:hypothetical protein
VVGAGGDDSDRSSELVVCVSQRLVLLGIIGGVLEAWGRLLRRGARSVGLKAGTACCAPLRKRQRRHIEAMLLVGHGDKYSRHAAEFCVILRLRLIPRLCCAVPLVESLI